jgi:hypothetical protein
MHQLRRFKAFSLKFVVRIPRGTTESTDLAGVLRLQEFIREANEFSPLRMTKWVPQPVVFKIQLATFSIATGDMVSSISEYSPIPPVFAVWKR